MVRVRAGAGRTCTRRTEYYGAKNLPQPERFGTTRSELLEAGLPPPLHGSLLKLHLRSHSRGSPGALRFNLSVRDARSRRPERRMQARGWLAGGRFAAQQPKRSLSPFVFHGWLMRASFCGQVWHCGCPVSATLHQPAHGHYHSPTTVFSALGELRAYVGGVCWSRGPSCLMCRSPAAPPVCS